LSSEKNTILLTVDAEYLGKLELYRALLERGHKSRGTPREVTLQEAASEALKLGLTTAEGMTALFGIVAAKKAKDEGKRP
jgi:hypothetical protein